MVADLQSSYLRTYTVFYKKQDPPKPKMFLITKNLAQALTVGF